MFKIRFRTLRFIVIAYLVLLSQASLVNMMTLKSIKPDFVLLLVIFFALHKGMRQGMFCGIILGFCVDTLSSGIFGINCLILGCVGFFTGMLKDRVYTTHFLTKILVAFCACLFSIIIYYALALNFHRLMPFSENLLPFTGTLIYTALFNIIFFNVLDKLVIERTTRLL